jgi:hypothetical protein
MLFWGIWAPQIDPKRFTKAAKGARCMAQYLGLKIRP